MSFLRSLNQAATKRAGNFDCYRKKLENPFYSKKKRIANLTGLKIKALLATIIILTGGLVWLVYFSNFFLIKNINIVGLNKITAEDVNSLIGEQMKKNKFCFNPQDNLIFFKKEELIESFQKNYRFQGIKIKKKWPKSLILEIKEKTLAAVWLEDGKYYYLDNEGYILGEANLLEVDGRQYPVIQNESDSKIVEGRIALDYGFIFYAAELLQKIPEKISKISIVEFSVNSELDSLAVILSDGPKIIFNTKDLADKQIERLSALKKEKINEDFSTKKYIDLRFGDKIYYQ